MATTFEDYDPEKLYLYAGIDAIVTNKILLAQRGDLFSRTFSYKGVEHPTISKVYEDIVRPAFDFILDMELSGILYDVDENRRLNQQVLTQMAELEDVFRPQVGTTNVHSDDQLGKLLYGTMELPVLTVTSKGAPSSDGDTLLKLSETTGHTWLAQLAKYKDLSALNNMFLQNYVSDFVKSDGRIHPTYNLHGTSGFRISGGDPNLTQLPRTKYGINVRGCYTVPEGSIFITLDYSSAEVKVLANICKDEKLLKALQDGLDPHTFSASNIFGVPYEVLAGILADPSHPEYKDAKGKRQLAKAVTFGILYGSTAKGLAMKNGVSEEEATRIMSMYLDEFPGIREYVREAHREAQKDLVVVTPFGRRKRQYGASKAFAGTAAFGASLRNAQNSIIQSTASDIGLVTFAEVNKRIAPLGARCICTVYDSIEIECPIERAAEVLEIAFYVMDDWLLERFPWMVIPIGVEAEIGPNWGNVNVVHRGWTGAQE